MIVDIGKYYLYRHIRLDLNEVFYIGIGTKINKIFKTNKNEYVRALDKVNRNKYWKNITRKTEYEIEIILESNNYEFIKQKEIEFIKLYGRSNLKLGTLCNLTNGGDGTIGIVASDKLREFRSKIKLLTKEEVINKCNIKHSQYYNYDKFIYTGSSDKSIIICPIHGEFEQNVSMHLLGKGCKKCGSIKGSYKRNIVKVKYHKSIIIDKFKEIHKQQYDYSKVEYINNKTKVIIICKVHGEFTTSPFCHLNGHGCKKCGQVKISEKNSKKIVAINIKDNSEKIIFDSIKECADYFNVTRSGIQFYLTKVKSPCKLGFSFKFYI